MKLNQQAWDDYQAYRRENKMRKLRPMSIERLQRWLCEQGDEEHQAAIVDQTIRNSWIGLFAFREGKPVNGRDRPIRGTHDWYRERAEQRVDAGEIGEVLESNGRALRPSLVPGPWGDD